MRTKSGRNDLYTPLAARMRPQNLDEFVGQGTVLGDGTALRRAIEQGTAGSLILWGPPGIGKTTLAYIIAAQMDAALERVSAVTAGVKDLREVIERAGEWQKAGKRTVLIVDEIHRFNKGQQDVLLPVVEEGLVTLIGATTENPYFEVVAALVSRAEVVKLEALGDEDVAAIVERALFDAERGLPRKKHLTKGAKEALVQLAGGDARRALNILERAALAGKSTRIGESHVTSAAQATVVQYDKKGDAHYDTISAFIKSLRGSDTDAALFYLFRMLVAGEDPRFVVRRMFIFASEDIGNADPHALMLVAAASQALEWVGLPEAEFALAHAATYLAAAPKSNSVYRAMSAAKEDVAKHGNAVPPEQVTNVEIKYKGAGPGRGSIPGQPAARSGEITSNGVKYKYPHDFPGHVVAQQYRPKVVQSNVYYEPGTEGFEKEVKRRVEAAREVLTG